MIATDGSASSPAGRPDDGSDAADSDAAGRPRAGAGDSGAEAAGSDLSADVVVVGAGPAGSAAAYHMAVAGLDVIVVERGEPGRDKVCGDGLTPSAVTELALMGVDTTGWRRNKGLRVVGGGHILHIPWPEQASLPSYGLARRRTELDRDLAERAAAAGARLLTGVTATAPLTSPSGRVIGVEVRPTPRAARPGVTAPAEITAPLVIDAGPVPTLPMYSARLMTNCSRIESIAGLVTCANCWRK